MSSERPILCVDVDGVISLFPFDRDVFRVAGEFHSIDGVMHCISTPCGDRLRRLGRHYDLVWASGWEEKANEYLPHILGLEGGLPWLGFDGRAVFGSSHWKLGAIGEYAGQRPLAWVDDCIDEECRAWAAERPAPTLLVPTESHIGLEEAHVETLIRWVKEGYTPR